MDPKLVADLASTLLTGQAIEDRGGASDRDKWVDLTLKGQVGRELETQGLQVDLEVYVSVDPGKVVGDIVAAVTPALSLGRPGQAGQR